MSLKIQIEEKLNKALKAKDKNTYPTLRLVVSAIKDAEINEDYKTMQKGISWFQKHFTNQYFILLD